MDVPLVQLAHGVQVGDIRIRDGNSKIHQHPQKQEILESIVAWIRTDVRKRPSPMQFEQMLLVWFPDLEIKGDGGYIRRFVRDYDLLQVAIPTPQTVLQALLEKAIELNLPARKLEVAERLWRRFEAMSRDPDVKPKDLAAVSQALISAIGDAESSLERYGIVPGKVQRSMSLEIKRHDVDLDGFERTVRGRGPVEVKATIIERTSGGDGDARSSTTEPEGAEDPEAGEDAS